MNAPTVFEANRGQFSSRVDYALRGPAYVASVNSRGVAFHLGSGGPDARSASRELRLRIANGARSAERQDDAAATGHVNYLIGKDPNAWIKNAPTYTRVRYSGIYPGVDVVYRTESRRLEYDFVVAPGGDPDAIRLRLRGGDRIGLDASRNLRVETAAGSVTFARPEAYQDIDGLRVPVSADFVVLGARNVAFAVGAYDMSAPLVIDPIVTYSTYLGGSIDDFGVAVDTDGTGAAYVAVGTASADLPDGDDFAGSYDVYIAKFNAAGDALVFATYLGGTGFEAPQGIAVDADGAVYVAGRTNSVDFPTTVGAFDTGCGTLGNQDVFVAKLDPSGTSLTYSTCIGGDDDDQALSMAVDSAGAVYVTGSTTSSDYPVTVGAYDGSLTGSRDALLTKLDPSGASLVYSTYLGGSSLNEFASGVAVEADGTAHVVGRTASADFPTTVGAFDTACGSDGNCDGSGDVFVTKMNADGTDLVYSSFLGGSSDEVNLPNVAVGADGTTYVTGDTISADFPTTVGAFQTDSGGGQVAFVSKLNAAGDALVYSTFFGEAFTIALDIDVDETGGAYVTGTNLGGNLPITPDAFDSSYDGNYEAFLMKLSADGSSLVYSTYLGGSGSNPEQGNGVVHEGNDVFVVGTTPSDDFPTTAGAFDTECGGCDTFNTDGFLVHLDFEGPPLCGPTPEPDVACRLADPAGAGKSSLQIKNDSLASKDSLKWKWNVGSATALTDFKMPDTGTATYRLCIYDGSAAPQPLVEADIRSGGVVPMCGKKPCWKATGTTGFKYKSKAAFPDGITGVKFKAGSAGKSQVQVKGKGALLGPPATGSLAATVVVQLLIDDGGPLECFKTSFGPGGVTTQDSTQFKAKGP